MSLPDPLIPMILTEAQQQTQLLKSIEWKVSVVFWVWVASCVIVCGIFVLFLLGGFSIINAVIQQIPTPTVTP